MTDPDPMPWRDWHFPLDDETTTLRETLAQAEEHLFEQDDVPLIVQIVENPRFKIPWVNLLRGRVDLHDHDCIHALLGRGLLAKDEAFVIGFTMGSTNRITTAQAKLYELAARYLYPGTYRFTDDDVHIFQDAVALGFVSDCTPLDQVDYRAMMHMSLGEVRRAVGLETALLKAYYAIEAKRYPGDPASSRLL